jgi:hypothetical protein
VTSVRLGGAEPTGAAAEPASDAMIRTLAVGALARAAWCREEASGPSDSPSRAGTRPPGPADRPGLSRPACPRTRTGKTADDRSGGRGRSGRGSRPAASAAC